MLGYTQVFGLLAACVAASAYGRYMYAISLGATKPSKASWIVWSVVGVIIALGFAQSGGGDAVPATVVYALGPPIILIMVFKYSNWEMKWNEWGAVIVSAAALYAWIKYKSPVIGLYVEISADLLGAYGTALHAYRKPEEEDVPTWLLSLCGALINLLAVKVWDFSSHEALIKSLYPLIVCCMCLVILLFSLRHNDKQKRSLTAQ